MTVNVSAPPKDQIRPESLFCESCLINPPTAVVVIRGEYFMACDGCSSADFLDGAPVAALVFAL